MVDTRNILLGAVSGALAASAVLLVAHAITPSTAQSPAVYPLVRAQVDAAGSMANGEGTPVVQSSVRPKDQSSLLTMAQAPADAPAPVNGKTVLPAVIRDCLRLAEGPFDISDSKAFAKLQQDWIAACEKAMAADSDNPKVQVALGRAYSSVGGKDQAAIDLFRAAARRNDAQAWHQIYERFKSFDRGRTDRPQLVKRPEAEQALRRAAELGHPYATMMLAVLLDRGGTVKRDAEDAIHWAEISLTRPVEDEDRGSMQVRLGRLLVKSTKPEQRARGVKLLEALAVQRGDAKAELAKAIRNDDPVRARKLLEDSQRTYPGHAIPALADMLIKGEGGPKDEKRAVSLVSAGRASDVPAVRVAHGRLLVEGRLLPRDLVKGIGLIDSGAGWDQDTRLELMGLLAKHPDVKLNRPESLMVDAMESATLDEPGALAALVDLKLSGHVQFGDKAGGCELARKSGDKDLSAKVAERCALK